MSIYVEICILGSIDDLWRYTQSPELHRLWDLRFTDIEYLPRPDASAPQQFLYETRIGFGVSIRGAGESVGSRCESDGVRTSALKFWSDDPKSLIREGAGYWQYVPTSDGIRFITSYDYRVRFGAPGQAFDALFFRPIMGWATAWSFDRLRIWIEKGVDPRVSRQLALIHAIAVGVLAFVWIYQGAVPKLLTAHPDEIAMMRDAGIAATATPFALQLVGWGEIALGALTLVFHRSRWPYVLTIVLMGIAIVGVVLNSPRHLTAAFNPVALNSLMAALAMIALLARTYVPSARRCLRKKSE